ncbi:MAG: sodium/solute symporter [Fuerstiella sp.]|nr:sodium/solute symporter [Fuerstiella sp.]
MSDPGSATGLDWLDVIVVGVYIGLVLGIGWYYGRQQRNTDEYFVGNRGMNSTLVGISMYATLFSTITYLSTPGEYLSKGPVIFCTLFSIPIVYFLVGYWIIPVYMKHRVTSAYELLEDRLGVKVRLLAAGLFILIRLAWMSLLIYLPAISILEMLGLEEKWLPAVVFTTGGVAIVYASIGGLRAVVVTDLFQFLLLFGGAILVIATVTFNFGGFDWFPTSWQPGWDRQPLFSTDPNVRVTVFGTILGGVLWWLCTAGSDQTAIQRFMSTGSAAAARRSFLINSCAGASVALLLALVGFSLLGFYQAHPEFLPDGQSIEESADKLFPSYLARRLPGGVAGLVLAALFAAAMSSLDSGVNSISAVTLTDFVDRCRSRPLTEKQRILAARSLAFGIGLIVVCVSSFVIKHVPGNFMEITNRVSNLLISPLFLPFFMAIFVPFSTAKGAIAAMISSSAAAIVVAYWKPLVATLGIEPVFFKEISFQWIQPCALVTGIAVGCGVSLLERMVKRQVA